MPVQVSAKDMDPLVLKREYGADISFFGGMDTQSVLPTRTPEQIRAEVRRLIDAFGKDGGYIFSSSHNLTADIPTENIVAMYEEAAAYYPF
jgi:uroporphyrinogen decarboxylase